MKIDFKIKFMIILGLTMILLGILISCFDKLIEVQCYELTPNDFYSSKLCMKYRGELYEESKEN